MRSRVRVPRLAHERFTYCAGLKQLRLLAQAGFLCETFFQGFDLFETQRSFPLEEGGSATGVLSHR
jgi:hypothetical protein